MVADKRLTDLHRSFVHHVDKTVCLMVAAVRDVARLEASLDLMQSVHDLLLAEGKPSDTSDIEEVRRLVPLVEEERAHGFSFFFRNDVDVRCCGLRICDGNIQAGAEGARLSVFTGGRLRSPSLTHSPKHQRALGRTQSDSVIQGYRAHSIVCAWRTSYLLRHDLARGNAYVMARSTQSQLTTLVVRD